MSDHENSLDAQLISVIEPLDICCKNNQQLKMDVIHERDGLEGAVDLNVDEESDAKETP